MSITFPKDRASKWISVLVSFFITFSLSINLSTKSGSWSGLYAFLNDFAASVNRYDISKIFLAFLLYFFILYCIGILKQAENIKRDIICAGLPALLFGVFMSIGYSYKTKGTYELVFGNAVQLIKSGTYSMGWTLLFFGAILLAFRALDRVNLYEPKSTPKNGLLKTYVNCLEKKPFITAFVTMLLGYLPYMILSYPGCLMGDAFSQVTQGYNMENYNAYFNLISENVKINNHHPVTHTMLLHLCLRIGELFQSQSFGLGLYSLVQTLFVLIVWAWVIQCFTEYGFSLKIRVGLMVYYVLHPRISAYMYLLSKDIIFTAFLLVFFLLLYQVLLGKENRKNYVLLAFSTIGTMLFRNDGIYLVLAAVVVVALVIKRFRKKFLALAGMILLFSFFWNSILLPVLQISPGGRREMLSIPMQQTARYVRDAGNEVTEEERAAIDKVLVYDTLAEKYNPYQSDQVKATFREKTATTEDLINYFKVWLQMFFKHPDIYIQATLHNKYDMFYFDSARGTNYSYDWSEQCMEMLNNLPDDKLDMQLEYPESLRWVRDWYEYLREKLTSLPFFNLLVNSAVYINIFVVWMFYGIRKKSKRIPLLGIPVIMQLLVIVAGPCQASYFRYVYPIAVILPVMILLGLHMNREKAVRKEIC